MSDTRPATDPRLDALRAEIDALDERIVALLAERGAVVTRVGALKRELGSDEDAVRARDRVEGVVRKVREMATARGLDPRIADRTYRALIDALTDMQLGRLDEPR